MEIKFNKIDQQLDSIYDLIEYFNYRSRSQILNPQTEHLERILMFTMVKIYNELIKKKYKINSEIKNS